MATALARGTALTGVIELLEEMGLDVDAIVAETGVPRAVYGDIEARIPLNAAAILLAAVEREGAWDFGLRLGARRRLSNWGAFGTVVRSQPDLRQVLLKISEFFHVQIQAIRLALVERPETSELHLNFVSELEPGATRQSVDLMLAVFHRNFTETMGDGWRPLVICLRHAPPVSTALYRQIFGTDVIFEQEFDGFLLRTEDLDIKTPGADPVAAQAAEQGVTLLGPERLSERVAETAIMLLPEGRCSGEEVADLLGMNLRTMQRRLAEEETTFAELVEIARGRMAQVYIETSTRSLAEAAGQLGFASQAAFNHWHRARHGETPSARRRRARAEALAAPCDIASTA
jgi:AraC-like DNA-binding protein